MGILVMFGDGKRCFGGVWGGGGREREEEEKERNKKDRERKEEREEREGEIYLKGGKLLASDNLLYSFMPNDIVRISANNSARTDNFVGQTRRESRGCEVGE